MTIKAVIFDLGGVIIQWKDRFVYKKAAKIAGVPVEKLIKAADAELAAFCAGSINETEFWRRVLTKTGSNNHVLLKLDRLWFREYSRHSKLNLKLIAIARKLRRKYRLALLSNLAPVHDVINIRRKYYRFFHTKILSYKVRLAKPDVRIYKLAARRLRLQPKECVFVDDKLRNVKGARRAGMKSIHYRSITQLRRDLRKYGIK